MSPPSEAQSDAEAGAWLTDRSIGVRRGKTRAALGGHQAKRRAPPVEEVLRLLINRERETGASLKFEHYGSLPLQAYNRSVPRAQVHIHYT